MRTVGLLVLLICLVCTPPAWGQGIPVYDSLNHLANTTTSLQTAISAIQTVLHTGYWIVELTGLGELVLAAEYAEDLTVMQALLSDARALAWDFRSIEAQVQRLFNPKGAPHSTQELSELEIEIRQTLWEAYSYASRVQGLVATIARTIEHMRQFVNRIQALLGNRQALQAINEQQAKLVQVQTQQYLTTTALQRAQTLEGMRPIVIQQAIININEAIMFDMPGAK